MNGPRRIKEKFESVQNVSLPTGIENARVIPLTKGMITIVDEDFFIHASKFNWIAKGRGDFIYAVRQKWLNGKQTTIRMHREALNLQEGHALEVHHINGNALDNRKCNLEVCSASKHRIIHGKRKMNTSGHKGVYWFAETKKWVVKIRRNNICTHLGYFADKGDAIMAYSKHVEFLEGRKP